MPLIKSISGIRGTIGGKIGENLTPLDVVNFTSAYCKWVFENTSLDKASIVTGRDARISGPMVHELVNQTILSMGINVIDLGLSTTPTVSYSVPIENAQGGIIITASHNTKEWNALKLLNSNGEFIDSDTGLFIIRLIENQNFEFSKVDNLGKIIHEKNYINKHIDSILNLAIIDVNGIKKKKFKVVVDGINSSGGIAVPLLLDQLNVEYVKINCDPTGDFAHNPEPIKENLNQLCEEVVNYKADFGIAVDPDVDRLVFVDENGDVFGEEYTLVACADFILSKTPGNTVSNLSSSRALSDLTHKYGFDYFASPVGEVNVIEMMKKVDAVIGGEGNGGVIYPKSHYGRDALIGIGFFMCQLLNKNCSVSELKRSYSQYYMSKKKINLSKDVNIQLLIDNLKTLYIDEKIDTKDGLKIDFEDSWVHLRKSNTEMIIRIYSEANSQVKAELLSEKIISNINSLI
jgi:phosphomannomutase